MISRKFGPILISTMNLYEFQVDHIFTNIDYFYSFN